MSRRMSFDPYKMKILLQGLLLIMVSTVFGDELQADKRVDYTGHMIIRTRASDKLQLDHLWSLKTNDKNLDFWTEVLKVGHPVDIHIHSERFTTLSASLNSAGIKHHIKVADLGKAIEEERQTIEARREKTKNQKALDFENYHTYEEIVQYLRQLESENSLVSVGAIANTYENRDVIGVQVSSNIADLTKPVIAIECGVHAREWAAPSTCLWFINELVTQYGNDTDVTRLVDGFNWEIAPLMNPDGYEFTWTTDRLWRKNRRPIVNCVGVDLNRNFDVGFGGPGSSGLECDETYRGPYNFSEPESSGIRDILTAYRNRIKAAVSIHTYSQFWVSPYGYKSELPRDYPEMLRMMEIGVRGIAATFGTVYDYGNHADTIYNANGVTIDHAYDGQGILHSYLLELRDTGEFGFELPADQIIPTAIETWNGIKAMALDILRNQE